MYDKVPNNMNFVEREVQVEKYWKDNDIFGKSIKAREGAPVFTFYDGPPTANGKPHIGHIITRAVKDLIPRYKTMKGYKVLRKAGWDTHGLPRLPNKIVDVEIDNLSKMGVKFRINRSCSSMKLLDTVQIAFKIVPQSVRVRNHLTTRNRAFYHHRTNFLWILHRRLG